MLISLNIVFLPPKGWEHTPGGFAPPMLRGRVHTQSIPPHRGDGWINGFGGATCTYVPLCYAQRGRIGGILAYQASIGHIGRGTERARSIGSKLPGNQSLEFGSPPFLSSKELRQLDWMHS